jgi:hypothetical protein
MVKMKTLLLLFILVISGLATSAQNEKCLAFSTDIIKDIKAKIQSQAVDYNDVYFVKAEFPSTYDLETIKTVCDTSAKTTKVSFNWRLNYDKNYEKEYVINSKKILITIYFNDKFLYFEFPKE